MQQQQLILLQLSLIEKIGPNFLYELVIRVGFDRLVDLYELSEQGFIALGCAPDKARLLKIGLSSRERLQAELDLIAAHDVTVVTLACAQYPKMLKEIDVPPLVLYCQGDISLFGSEKMFACVGARKSNRYAYDALMRLVVPMIEDNWVIVSGGAAGADTFAHQITLDHKGATIVVVGSGLVHQYPPQNKTLFEKVVYAGGLIVSSFHMNMAPVPHCFPIRNRIISGLSRGCLVLQAEAKSGALITAQFALQQGREVFALPGSIFDPLSVGCHNLISQGAKLVTCCQDILDELLYVSSQPREQQLSICEPAKVRAKVATKIKKDLVVNNFDEIEHLILHYAVVPLSSDKLLSQTGLSLEVLQKKLFSLSLDGHICQDGMGLWKRV